MMADAHPDTEAAALRKDSDVIASVPHSAPDDTQFSSRWAFWLSAIGCSVGFGNLWRFPYLVYDYGGVAFLIPYFLALIVVVLPVAFLEFGVGQLSQGGNVKAFRAVHRRVACVGWSFFTGINVLQYYPLLLSWSLMYFVNSFKKDMPWLVSDVDVATCERATTAAECLSDPACSWDGRNGFCAAFILNKAMHFFETGISAKSAYWEGITEFNIWIWLCELVSWSLVFLSTVGGAKILGYVNYFTTTAPAVFLLILVCVGATLDGAGEGIKEYIGKFDAAKLSNAAVWTAACGQALFSMGGCQGSMAGYAAHNKRDQNFVQDTYVVAFGDTFFAVIAGFAVFSVIGFMSFTTGIPISGLPLSGSGLAFQTYPVGIGQGIPYPGAQIFSVLFFMTLWLLGMSTAVALTEAACLVISESKFYAKFTMFKRWHAYLALCIVLFCFSFIYSTDMGKHVLDCTDHFNSSLYIFVAGCEAISGGWFGAWELYKERAGAMAVYVHLSSWILGVTLGSIIGFATPTNVGRIAGPILGVLVMGGGFVAALMITRTDEPRSGKQFSMKDRLYNLTFYNVNQLRKYMNDAACKDTIWRIPRVWCVCVKYIIPVVTTIMFFINMTDPYQMYKKPMDPEIPGSEPYPWWVFLIGSFGPYVGMFGIMIFFFLPRWMEWLYPVDEVVFEYEDDDSRQRLDDVKNRVNELRESINASQDPSDHKGNYGRSRSSSSSSSGSSSKESA